jgi:hypothetical protein
MYTVLADGDLPAFPWKRAAVLALGGLLTGAGLYVAAMAMSVTLWASLWTVSGWFQWS